MGYIGRDVTPHASFHGIFYAVNGKYAFSLKYYHPVAPLMGMGFMGACKRIQVKASENIIGPKMCRSENYLL